MLQDDNIEDAAGVKRYAVAVYQSGNNIDKGPLGATPLPVFPARERGRLARVFGGNIFTALLGDATHDVMPLRYPKFCGLTRAAITMIPMLDSPGLRLGSLNLAGQILGVAAPAELVVTSVLQAPGAANRVVLAAADTAPDGTYCDADIEIIAGTGVGQKNRITSYATGTKIATLKFLEGTPNWKVATAAGSVARITTRRTVVEKDDIIHFDLNFTVGTGTAGVDCVAGVDIICDQTARV